MQNPPISVSLVALRGVAVQCIFQGTKLMHTEYNL